MEARLYQCPCCGASLQWSGASGKLNCAACGNEFPVETLEQLREDSTQMGKGARDFTWQVPAGEEDSSLRAFGCPSCGAEIVVSDTGAAAQCPYCGNPTVMPQVLSGEFRPNKVIPFKKTVEDAREAYRAMCAKKKLLPRGFGGTEQLNKIRGIYVPFWLFDCETDADFTYRATRVKVRRSGNYQITSTSHYHVRRGGRIRFDDLPVNSSTKLDDTLMEAVEPYEYGEARSFNAAYLTGYEAERYNQEVSQCSPRARERIVRSVKQICDASVTGYSSVTPEANRVDVVSSHAENVLMPVYLLNTPHKGKQYTFAMNGQTGRIRGDLPVDPGKAAFSWVIWFLICAGIGLAVIMALLIGGVIG